MKEEAESLQSPPSSVSGSGPQKQGKVAEEAAAPVSVKLEIGIGVAVIKEEKRHLTAEQKDEFERQVLIYRYIAAGVPVPSSLVRPFWKNVDDSPRFPIGATGIHRQHASSVGISKEYNSINMMDPEPERCRRTDGKKWRCRKTVIPGQKYCQQHIHRGCGRLRKPAGSSQTSNAAPRNQPTKNSENLNPSCFYSSAATTPIDTILHHKASGATSRRNVDFKIKKETLGLKNAAAIMTPRTIHTDSTVTTATTGADKGADINCYKSSIIDYRSRNCTCQKLNFSPKSVLQVQGGGNLGCRGEVEGGRCRRTDGKKWRCRRDVVPDEKYCNMHMHRGTKKRLLAHQSPLFPRAAPLTNTSSGLNRNAIMPRNVNTNLSISITASPQLRTKDDSNTRGEEKGHTAISSSSDTISDTIVASCDYKDVTS